MTDETTNPVGGEAMPEVADANPSETDALNPETDNQEISDDFDGDDADFEEVEFEGETYRVPSKLKDGLLRQADYTRKTQEVATQRQEVEAQRASIQQAAQRQVEFAQDIAQYGALNARLAPFAQVTDWPSYLRQGGAEAQANYAEFQALTQERDKFAQSLGSKVQQRASEEQREAAKLVEAGRAELAKQIPGYSPAVLNKLADVGAQYGFSRDEILQAEADPRSIRVLHEASLWREQQARQKATTQAAKADAVSPVKTVTARSVPPQGLNDRLGADEWMRRREQQLRKAKG